MSDKLMMFASRTARDLNHDPKAWVDEQGQRHRWIAAYVFGMKYNPRPEFDHVQHNAPNRRLIAFRREVELHRAEPEIGISMQGLARSWIERNDGADSVTDAEFHHSQGVLIRLANLAPEQEN